MELAVEMEGSDKYRIGTLIQTDRKIILEEVLQGCDEDGYDCGCHDNVRRFAEQVLGKEID